MCITESTTFAEFERKASLTAQYPGRRREGCSTGEGILYTSLGLTGEAGEVAECVKKSLRDDGGIITRERREKIIGELGDVLWYLAATCHEIGVTLKEVANANSAKLMKRQAEGKIHGSGSDR